MREIERTLTLYLINSLVCTLFHIIAKNFKYTQFNWFARNKTSCK